MVGIDKSDVLGGDSLSLCTSWLVLDVGDHPWCLALGNGSLGFSSGFRGLLLLELLFVLSVLLLSGDLVLSLSLEEGVLLNKELVLSLLEVGVLSRDKEEHSEDDGVSEDAE